ncbi:MAG: hypothetical protein KDN22_31990 [Verrucomicrobiae bacterium]|nr:hypothetical protein [Verrucomicrobiae bacterium]
MVLHLPADVEVVRATNVVIGDEEIIIIPEAITTIRTISGDHDPTNYKVTQIFGQPCTVSNVVLESQRAAPSAFGF